MIHEPFQFYIYAGVTRRVGPVRIWEWPVYLYWLFAQWLVGKGKFIHCYLGFDEHGRRYIYHTTKHRSHIMLRGSFLLKRIVVDEWAIPVDPELHRSFADGCFADSGLIPYGHIQNIFTGVIKLWNRIVKLLRLHWLMVHRNPFGAGKRKQNCSEKAGRKLAETITGGHFVKVHPDYYGPDDFHDECLAYAQHNPKVRRTVSGC